MESLIVCVPWFIDLSASLMDIIRVFSTLWIGQNGCHFADDNVRYIFLNEKYCILISLEFFLRVQLRISQYLFRQCSAPSHNLNQCCPSSIMPHDITMPQWGKTWYFELILIYIVIKITSTLGIIVGCSTGIWIFISWIVERKHDNILVFYIIFQWKRKTHICYIANSL